MLKHAKKTLVALGAIALLGASAGAQAWDGYGRDGYGYDYGRHHEVHRDWRELQRDRYERHVYAERARHAAYYGNYRAAHAYHRAAEQKDREVHWDHRQLHEDRDGRW